MGFFEETANEPIAPEDPAAIIGVARNTFRICANAVRSIPRTDEDEERHAAQER